MAADALARNKKYIVTGWVICLAAPLAIVMFAIVNYLVGAGSIPRGSAVQTVLDLIIFVIGALAIPSLPVGISLIVAGRHYRLDRPAGSAIEVPAEARGWSWGAFGLGPIWGVANGVWLSFLMYLPYVNILMWFVLGAKGNEWAWKKKQWSNVDEFRTVQQRWRPWGIGVFIAEMVALGLVILARRTG